MRPHYSFDSNALLPLLWLDLIVPWLCPRYTSIARSSTFHRRFETILSLCSNPLSPLNNQLLPLVRMREHCCRNAPHILTHFLACVRIKPKKFHILPTRIFASISTSSDR